MHPNLTHMQTRLIIWNLGLLLVFPAMRCWANVEGCDNFNGDLIDITRWSAPIVYSGVGWLTETNQRMEFITIGTPTTQDGCLLQWIANTGSYTQDWELQVELNFGMAVFTNTSPHPSAHINLLVAPSNAIGPNCLFGVELGVDTSRYFHSMISSNGDYTEPAWTETSATNLAVRITFDSGTKILSAFFDEDGHNGGCSWQPFGSAIVPASWGMTTNEFSVVLMGIAHNVAVSSTNNVFFDNFKASSGSIPKPWIRHLGNSVAISWPTNAPACQVESTMTLTPPVCWSVATNAVGTTGTNFTASDTVASRSKFFRLNRHYDCQ